MTSAVCLLHRLSQGFARSTEQARSARAGDKREARERDDWNERIAQGGSNGSKTGEEGKANLLVASSPPPPSHSFRPRFPQ